MSILNLRRRQWSLAAFTIVFSLCVMLGASLTNTRPSSAAPLKEPLAQEGAYAGSSSCTQCHEEIHTAWVDTRHAQAFSTPIFQRDWEELDEQTSCLQCHTTGFDPSTGGYAEEGVWSRRVRNCAFILSYRVCCAGYVDAFRPFMPH